MCCLCVAIGSARSESEKIGDRLAWRSRYIRAAKRKTDALCVVQDRVFNTRAMLNAYAGYMCADTCTRMVICVYTRMVICIHVWLYV